jgi:hypothetical protein
MHAKIEAISPTSACSMSALRAQAPLKQTHPYHRVSPELYILLRSLPKGKNSFRYTTRSLPRAGEAPSEEEEGSRQGSGGRNEGK